MKAIAKFLFILFVSVACTGNSMAQGIEGQGPRDLQPLIDALNDDLAELRFLDAELSASDAQEQEILIYRRDERSFRLLADYDNLVSEVHALPAGTERKDEIQEQLASRSADVGKAILDRIEEFRQRLSDMKMKAESLSGGAFIAAEAYIHTLESMRIKYYEALVSHMGSRELLGQSSENLRKRMEPGLYLYAETLAGQIELTGASLEQLQARLDKDPENADISSTLLDLDARHRVNLSRLEAIIMVLDDLGLTSSEYKTVMLQQSDGLSVSLFSSTALFSVLKDSWTAVKNATEENAPDIFFRVLLFLAVLFVFRILSRIVRRVVRAASERSSLDMSELLKNILVSTSGGAVMALGILMALSQVGISLAPMLAGLGVAGFIVGFALQDSLGNFAAGAMILIYRPFDVDDFVEVTGAAGLVKKMNLVSTTIATFDNQILVVPNSKIWGDVIKNVTAQTERRVDLEVGVSYDDDVEQVEQVLQKIVAAHPKTLDHPKPLIKVHALADSSVNFIVRPWVKTDDYWDVYWDLMREMKVQLEAAGITIPYPQRDIHIQQQKDA